MIVWLSLIFTLNLLGGNSEDHGRFIYSASKHPATTSTPAIPSHITSIASAKSASKHIFKCTSSSSIRHGFECTVITDITFPTPPPPQHVSSPSPTKDLLGGNSHSHQHKNPTTTSTPAIPSDITSSSPTKAIFTASPSRTDNAFPATDTTLNLTVSPSSNTRFQAIYIESALSTPHCTPNMTSYATSNSPRSPTLAASTIDNRLPILPSSQYIVDCASKNATTTSTLAIPSDITSSSPTKARSASKHTFKCTPNAPLYCTSNDGEAAIFTAIFTASSSMTDSALNNGLPILERHEAAPWPYAASSVSIRRDSLSTTHSPPTLNDHRYCIHTSGASIIYYIVVFFAATICFKHSNTQNSMSKFNMLLNIKLLTISVVITTATAQILYMDNKLVPDDGAANDRFGRSVSISGNHANGSAYIYSLDNETAAWNQVAKLVADDGAGGDRFGVSVSISTWLHSTDNTRDIQQEIIFNSSTEFCIIKLLICSH